MTDDGRAESARIPSRYAAGEEDPNVRTIAGAGYFYGCWDAQLLTRLVKCFRIVLPFRPIEIGSKKMASFISQ